MNYHVLYPIYARFSFRFSLLFSSKEKKNPTVFGSFLNMSVLLLPVLGHDQAEQGMFLN